MGLLSLMGSGAKVTLEADLSDLTAGPWEVQGRAALAEEGLTGGLRGDRQGPVRPEVSRQIVCTVSCSPGASVTPSSPSCSPGGHKRTLGLETERPRVPQTQRPEAGGS